MSPAYALLELHNPKCQSHVALQPIGMSLLLVLHSDSEEPASTHSQIRLTFRPVFFGHDSLLNSQHRDGPQLQSMPIIKVQQGMAKDGTHATEHSQDVVLECHQGNKPADHLSYDSACSLQSG